MSRKIILWIPARFLTSWLLYCTFWVIMDSDGCLIIYWNGFVSSFLLFVVEYMSQASFDFSTRVIFNCSLFCCLFCRYRWQGWEIAPTKAFILGHIIFWTRKMVWSSSIGSQLSISLISKLIDMIIYSHTIKNNFRAFCLYLFIRGQEVAKNS